MIKRISFIDLFKAFGIIIMIIGHIKAQTQTMGSLFLHLHASFNMPMFFFISGFLYKDRLFSEQSKAKFKTLIIPYIYFGLLLFLIEHIINKLDFFEWIKSFGFINNNSVFLGSELWFLTALFFCNIIFCLIIKLKNKFFLILLGLLIIEINTNINLPYSINSAIYMLPVFYVGYAIKNLELTQKKEVLLAFTLLVISSLLSINNDIISVRSNFYGNIYIFYITCISMSLGFFYLFKNIDKINILQKLNINYIGQNSLDYFCLNRLIIILLTVFLYINNPVFVFICSLIILYCLSKFLNFIRKNLRNFIIYKN